MVLVYCTKILGNFIEVTARVKCGEIRGLMELKYYKYNTLTTGGGVGYNKTLENV